MALNTQIMIDPFISAKYCCYLIFFCEYLTFNASMSFCGMVIVCVAGVLNWLISTRHSLDITLLCLI